MLTSYPTEAHEEKTGMSPRKMKRYCRRRESGNPLFLSKFIAKHLPEYQTIAAHPRMTIYVFFGVLCIVLAWTLHPGSMSEGQVLDGPKNVEEDDSNRRRMADEYRGWSLDVVYPDAPDAEARTAQGTVGFDTWTFDPDYGSGLTFQSLYFRPELRIFIDDTNVHPSDLQPKNPAVTYSFTLKNPVDGAITPHTMGTRFQVVNSFFAHPPEIQSVNQGRSPDAQASKPGIPLSDADWGTLVPEGSLQVRFLQPSLDKIWQADTWTFVGYPSPEEREKLAELGQAGQGLIFESEQAVKDFFIFVPKQDNESFPKMGQEFKAFAVNRDSLKRTEGEIHFKVTRPFAGPPNTGAPHGPKTENTVFVAPTTTPRGTTGYNVAIMG